jgi:hypothetical protein
MSLMRIQSGPWPNPPGRRTVRNMRWVFGIIIFFAGAAGAAFVYQWDGHISVPLAIVAIALVLACMVISIDGPNSSRPTPERRFNQPPGTWPRQPDDRPDPRRYRRR